MKYKLVLIFDDGSEVVGLEKLIMFNNVMDAESFLMSVDKFKSVKIDIENNHFRFSVGVWNGSGTAYWALDKS